MTNSQNAVQHEPDWSDSKTAPSELWKNPLFPMADRLEMADGAVRWRDEVIANLRRQLAAPDLAADHLQDAARYMWLQNWYLRGGLRAEIDPLGHIRETTPEIMDAAIDAAMK